MTARLHKLYTLTIEVLTPLHIGTGDNLLLDYDFAVRNNKTWVFNESALLDYIYEGVDNDRLIDRLQNIPAVQLLKPQDYVEGSPLFRYVMNGKPNATTPGSRIQQQIKNSADQPYIPGSSLKGAIRTALLSGSWNGERLGHEGKDQLRMEQMGRNSKFAAQSVEHTVFGGTGMQGQVGKFPNYDLMRALQISDSNPVDPQTLRVENVVVQVGQKDPGAPIVLETIQAKTSFKMVLGLDGFLIQKATAKQLGWDDARKHYPLLRNIPVFVNDFTFDRLERDEGREWSGVWKSAEGWLRKQAQTLSDNQFLLQLGWGGGWDSKTMASHLVKNRPLLQKLNEQYTIFRAGRGRDAIDIRNKERVPTSRRIVMRNDQLHSPMGWVKVTMEEM